MKTVDELWDYIVKHELLGCIQEDGCWLASDGTMYVEYFDEDYPEGLTVHPLEYVERTDEDVAEVTRNTYFPSIDWDDLNRMCCVELAKPYREYLKKQLSYLQDIYYNS